MIAIKLTVEQLIEALRGLTEKEKVQVKAALNKDDDKMQVLEKELTNRYRKAASDAVLFEKGELKTYSLSELLDEL